MEPVYKFSYGQPAPPRRRRLLKFSAILLTVTLVFAGGVLVGRGELNIRGLSKNIASSQTGTFDYTSVDQVYNLLKKDFDGTLDKSKLLDGIKAGLVDAAGDPYTEYFNPKQAQEFDQELSGSFTGIGAELGTDEDNNIVIVSPLSGYPAEAAGLLPKDIITAINGQSTTGLGVSEAVNKIRGEAGTKITLSIVRNKGKPFDVTITRTQINVPSVKYSVDGNIGYIKISQFNHDTYKLVQDAAKEFKTKNVKAIVLDLRSNPGGYLDSAVKISSLWLDSGKPIVSERRGSTILEREIASGEHPFKGLPTVVLINSGSASASEITAGALRDNGAATIVGIKSFGKGSVQQVESLAGGSELKVTIARWYTPKGANIDKHGITPDVSLDMSEADQKAGKDPQKDKAIEILRSKI